MKKLLAFLLAIVSIVGLVSCVSTNDLYTLSVEIENSQLSSSIISYPKSKKYKAGTTLNVKTSIIMDAGIYVYLNNNEVKQIDEKGFWIYSFEMPAKDSSLYITMDQFYGRDEYTFGSIFGWTNYIEEKDIIRIKHKTEIASPYVFSNAIYTEDRTDISLFYDLLQEPLVRFKNTQQLKSGGKTSEITYFMNDYSHELSILDDNIVYWHDFSNSAYFKFKNEQYRVPEIKQPSLECHTFSYLFRLKGNTDVFYYQEESDEWINKGKFRDVFAFEFVEYVGDVSSNYYAYIDTGYYGKIYIYSNTLFEYKEKFYEIVGDYNFSLLND